MEIKKYRVICWQPENADLKSKVFVDIAPANGVIHDMMFYSRLKLYRLKHPEQMIRDVAKSVYLNVVDNQQISVEFSQRTLIDKETLLPQILETYHQMQKDGKESTLAQMLSAVQAENFKDEVNGLSDDARDFMRREARKRALMQKKQEYYAQTPQQEAVQQEQGLFAESCERRRYAYSVRAAQDAQIDPIERMKQRLQRDGD